MMALFAFKNEVLNFKWTFTKLNKLQLFVRTVCFCTDGYAIRRTYTVHIVHIFVHSSNSQRSLKL